MNPTPFVTEKIAAGHMIQRGDGKKDAEWLTVAGFARALGLGQSAQPHDESEPSWSPSMFEAAAFKRRRQAERVCTALAKEAI